MNWRRVLAVPLRQFYLVRGSASRVMPLFAWVAVDIVLWGYITRYLNHVTGSAMNFTSLMLGAVLLWDFYSRVMQGVTMVFFEDVWARNFLNIFASPISVAEYTVGLVLTSTVTSFVGLVVLFSLSTAVFGLSFFSYGVAIFPFLAILFLFGIALGIFASAVVLRLGPAAEWFIWPIPAFLSPFAGVFYPMDTLPAWMRLVGWLLPPSYVFEAMRGIVAGQSASMALLAWGGLLSVAYIVGASLYFAFVYRDAIRSGLIARYSAESVA